MTKDEGKKAAAEAATRAGATGAAVHAATGGVIVERGYAMVTPDENKKGSGPAMTHGTGHGIGREVHEPPLLTRDGIELVAGDVLTIEPGLYEVGFGGVRVEDMVVVTDSGCENLNCLPEGLDWR